MNRHRSARKLAGAVDAPAAASTTVSSDSLTDRQETFFADIARLSDAGCALANQGDLREGIRWVETAINVNSENELARRYLSAIKRNS